MFHFFIVKDSKSTGNRRGQERVKTRVIPRQECDFQLPGPAKSLTKWRVLQSLHLAGLNLVLSAVLRFGNQQFSIVVNSHPDSSARNQTTVLKKAVLILFGSEGTVFSWGRVTSEETSHMMDLQKLSLFSLTNYHNQNNRAKTESMKFYFPSSPLDFLMGSLWSRQ